MKHIFIAGRLALCVCGMLLAIAVWAQQSFTGVITEPSAAERAALANTFTQQTLFRFDAPALYRYVRKHPAETHLNITIGNSAEWPFSLSEYDLRSPDCVFIEDDKSGRHMMPRTECITYKGYLTTDNAEVRANIEPATFSLYINRKDHEYFIEPLRHFLPGADADIFVQYRHMDSKNQSNAGCSAGQTLDKKTDQEFNRQRAALAKTTAATCRKVELATEIDDEAWALGVNGSTVVGILNFVDLKFSAYIGTQLVIKGQHAWTGGANTDPYGKGTLCVNDDRLGEFRTYWNNNFQSVKQDLAVMFSGVNYGNTIGCAFTNTFGSPANAYAVIQWNVEVYNPLDIFHINNIWNDDYRRALILHEMGHVFGASHDNTNCSFNTGSIMCPAINNTSINGTGGIYFNTLAVAEMENNLTSPSGNLALRERYFASGGTYFYSYNLNGNELFGNAIVDYSNVNTPFVNVVFSGTDGVTLRPGFGVSGKTIGDFKAAIGPCDFNQSRNTFATKSRESFSKENITNTTGGNFHFRVSPNPFTNSFTLNLKLEQNSWVSVRLYDMMGKKVATIIENLQKQKGMVQLQYNNSKLPPATYLCVIEVNGKRFTEKVVKME